MSKPARPRTVRLRLSAALLAVISCGVTAANYFLPYFPPPTPPQGDTTKQKLDPAAWGANHVGQGVPEFVHGDECLFCHRNTTGAAWQRNAHATDVRQLEDAPALNALLTAPELSAVAPEVEYFLGGRHHVRFMKKSGYGKFAMLGLQAEVGKDGRLQRFVGALQTKWDAAKFADACAGCHATGVDAKERTFAAFGIDCYACHGNVTLDHTKDTSLMFLSKKRRSDARAIVSTCAQCHLRGGRSRSTGLPYANNFIAGDNLFQDFAVDWARADDPTLTPGERHVWRNARDVAVEGRETPNCITCHQVHENSTGRHMLAPRSPLCFDCHSAGGPFKPVRPWKAASVVCGY